MVNTNINAQRSIEYLNKREKLQSHIEKAINV